MTLTVKWMALREIRSFPRSFATLQFSCLFIHFLDFFLVILTVFQMWEITSLLWPPCVADVDIIFSSCGFFYLSSFISSPNLILSGQRLDVYHTSTHGVALVQNLERRSETCCARLAKNTGHKKVSKDRHLGTIAQFCRAISSQLKHISTIGKSC